MANRLYQFTSGNDTRLVRGGPEYFDLLEQLIRDAKHEIHLQTYIYADDSTGQRISAALVDAAKRGVDVFVLLDAYGSLELMRNGLMEQMWADAGIHIRWFGRLFTGENLNIGRRLHHKIFVADGSHTLVGGMNIADRYNDMDGIPAWLDFAIYAAGPVGIQLREVALNFWYRNPGEKRKTDPPWLKAGVKGNVPVRIVQNDWLHGIFDISDEYRTAFRHAREEVTIIGAYFLPGRRMRKSLVQALGRGVSVRILLSRHTDVWMAKYATRYLYGWLLHKGFLIYEWPVTVVHGKVAVVDDRWCTAGSYNLNYLSAYESIELNYVVRDNEVCRAVRQQLDELLTTECEAVTEEDFRRSRHWYSRMLEWISYRLFRLSMRVLMLIGRRKANMCSTEVLDQAMAPSGLRYRCNFWLNSFGLMGFSMLSFMPEALMRTCTSSKTEAVRANMGISGLALRICCAAV
jgi:cardiolipin synthase A/B